MWARVNSVCYLIRSMLLAWRDPHVVLSCYWFLVFDGKVMIFFLY